MASPTYREINLGKIFNGKSSYELAVEHGKFIGTEEQYVQKEQKAYDDIVKYGNNLKQELEGIMNVPDKITKRSRRCGKYSETRPVPWRDPRHRCDHARGVPQEY